MEQVFISLAEVGNQLQQRIFDQLLAIHNWLETNCKSPATLRIGNRRETTPMRALNYGPHLADQDIPVHEALWLKADIASKVVEFEIIGSFNDPSEALLFKLTFG